MTVGKLSVRMHVLLVSEDEGGGKLYKCSIQQETHLLEARVLFSFRKVTVEK